MTEQEADKKIDEYLERQFYDVWGHKKPVYVQFLGRSFVPVDSAKTDQIDSLVNVFRFLDFREQQWTLNNDEDTL